MSARSSMFWCLFPAGPDLVGAEVAEELVQLQELAETWVDGNSVLYREKDIGKPMKTFEDLMKTHEIPMKTCKHIKTCDKLFMFKSFGIFLGSAVLLCLEKIVLLDHTCHDNPMQQWTIRLSWHDSRWSAIPCSHTIVFTYPSILDDFPCLHIPYAPCMEYLPTFALKITQHVGKYSIHGASGIYRYF